VEKAKLLNAGEQGLVVEFGDGIDPAINRRVHRLAAAILGERIEAVIEVVPTYRSLLVYFDPLELPRRKLKELVAGLLSREEDANERGDVGKTVVVPVVYGGEFGPDLPFVAEHAGLSESEVIALHTSKPYLVYMLGFIPGFPYLGGMPERLSTPRLEKPRVKIPAGSVGIAGGQTGFYPLESPGGWRIIGRTPFQGYPLVNGDEPLFSAGDSLLFRRIGEDDYRRMREELEARLYVPEVLP